MITKAFSGGWYADCLPSGPYVVLIEGSHLDTDLGRVDFLAGAAIDTYEPLFVRLSDDGRAFAGQSHFHTSTVEYTSAGWRRINKEAIGVSPIIYDQANQLRISDGSIGSQGWRYVAVDGELITGDATYAPGPGFTLYEWTDLSRNGDTVIIGQGPEDGCHVWDGTAHRVLATGNCRFVRAHRVGDDVSVAIWRTGAPTLLIWATVDELRALPLVLVVVTPPPVVVLPPVIVVPPPPVVIPSVGVPVTADQIASVLAGAYFDRVCLHLGLPIGDGTQTAARPNVVTWILSKVKVIDDGYWTVFKRRCLGAPGDYEAFGSRVEWLLATKGTDAQLVQMLRDAYDRGDR